MESKYKTHIHCLSFDVTRRCNLNCDWCLKGESENIDITTDIIDSAFDKTKNMCIHSISIFGGEPLLRPDMINYIIDQIISRKLMVGSLLLYTNGTIKNVEVRSALERFCIYAKTIETEFCRLCNIRLEDIKDAEKVKIIIGHRYHSTTIDEVDNAIIFYSKKNDKILALKEEDEKRLGGILLGGKAEINYRKYITNPVNPDFVHMNNEECFIINNYNYSKFYSEFSYDNFIRIVISIASNGNVYPGTRYSYKEIDENPMFNILECNDFYQSVLNWCWEHPVNSNIRELRKKKMLHDWCKSHGYNVLGENNETVEEMLALNKIADEQERRAKIIHTAFPQLNLTQVDLVASLDMYISLIKLNINRKDLKSFIDKCTYLGNVVYMDIEDAKTYIHLIIGETDGTLTLDEIASLLCQCNQYSTSEKIQIIMEEGLSKEQAVALLNKYTNITKIAPGL